MKKIALREGSNTGSSAPSVTFTPTGESAKVDRVSLAPLDFEAAMKGLLKTPRGDKR